MITANGSIAAWHPVQDFPYEHTRPLPSLKDSEKAEFSRLSEAAKKVGSNVRAPVNAELKEIFYTTKHEWFTRTREERLQSVSAPRPKRK